MSAFAALSQMTADAFAFFDAARESRSDERDAGRQM